MIPQILVNAKTPRPDGLEADATFPLNSVSVPIALASTVGVTAFSWALTDVPSGSIASIASPNPAAPFSTTISILDKPGTYLLRGVANGDAASVKEVAITVLTRHRGLRIPARGETTQWDGARWWTKAIADSIAATDLNREGLSAIAMSDANYTAPPSVYAARVLRVTGALTNARDFVLPLTLDGSPAGWWTVINATTGGFALTVKGATGTSVSVTGSRMVVTDGVNFY